MQGFLKVVPASSGAIDTKYFILDATRRQLRIGLTKDEAAGETALVLLLDEVSSVSKQDATSIAIASSMMPPGTPPLVVRAPTQYLADNWYSSLTGQPPGVPSSQEKRPVSEVIKTSPLAANLSPASKKVMSADAARTGSNTATTTRVQPTPEPSRKLAVQPVAPSAASLTSRNQPEKKNDKVQTGEEGNQPTFEETLGGRVRGIVKWLVLIVVLYLVYVLLFRSSSRPTTSARTVVRDAETGASFIIESAKPTVSGSGEITFIGMVAWFFFLGAMGIAGFGGWLANKSRRDKGKMTWRFTEAATSFSVVDDPVQGVIVSEIAQSCPTIQAGVRIKGARVRQVDDVKISKEMTAEEVLKEIEARPERPLAIVFESDDQIEVDSVVESFGKRVGLLGLGSGLGCLFLFKSWMFPVGESEVSEHSRLYRVEKVAPPPPHLQSVSIWQFISWSLVAGVVALIGLWVFIRSFSSKAASDPSAPSSPQSVKETTTSSSPVPASGSNNKLLTVPPATPVTPVKASMPPTSSGSTPASSSSVKPKFVLRPVSSSSSTTTPSSVRRSSMTPVTPVQPARESTVSTAQSAANKSPTDLTINVNELPPIQPLNSVSSSYIVPTTLERYVAMRKSGLSEKAVRIAMTRDNITIPPEFLVYLSQAYPPSPRVARSPTPPLASPKAATTESAAPSTPTSNGVTPTFTPSSPGTAMTDGAAPMTPTASELEPKYQRMLDMGISKVTVASAIKRDGKELPAGW